jgi:hypothetical protein
MLVELSLNLFYINLKINLTNKPTIYVKIVKFINDNVIEKIINHYIKK